MEFYEKHKNQSDQFQVVTVHYGRAATFAELDERLKPIVDDLWKRPFPFPIMLDGEGKVKQEWGIFAFPTVVLIDPEGKLLRPQGDALDYLEQQLSHSKKR